MATVNPNEAPLTHLAADIIADAQRLIRQEIVLARREFVEEWTKARLALVLLAAGGVLVAASSLFFGFMLVYLLHDLAGLSEWASFLVVGAGLAGLGAVLLVAGVVTFQRFRLVPPEMVQNVRQDLKALTGAVAPPGPGLPTT